MRSVESILRTYNIVNSRATSRYTIRFAAAFLMAGVFIVAAFMLLNGGGQETTSPGEHLASQGSRDSGAGGTATADEPFVIGTVEGAEWTYVGYPLAQYDPIARDRYDRDTLHTAVLEWLHENADVPTLGAPEPVHDPYGDGTLMGYLIHYALPSGLADQGDTP